MVTVTYDQLMCDETLCGEPGDVSVTPFRPITPEDTIDPDYSLSKLAFTFDEMMIQDWKL